MKQHLTQLGLAICTMMCGLSGISGSAQAASGTGSPPLPEFLASHDSGSAAVKVQIVDDDVLAGQTGKYAGGTMISGFVLNIISQWRLPNGVTALAQGTLGAAQNALGQVTTSVSTLASVTGGGPGSHANAANSGANPNAQVNGGQSITVNGVSQVTQVAGDRNCGANSALIDFNNNAVTLAGTANARQPRPAIRPAPSKPASRSATTASVSRCRRRLGSPPRPSSRATGRSPSCCRLQAITSKSPTHCSCICKLSQCRPR
jgi:hypothetical protein